MKEILKDEGLVTQFVYALETQGNCKKLLYRDKKKTISYVLSDNFVLKSIVYKLLHLKCSLATISVKMQSNV